MKQNKHTSTLSLIFTFVFAVFAFAGEAWHTNIDEGVKVAKEEKKLVMVKFTGSDWCPPCKMMEKKVFSKKEFVRKATEDYVLVILDVPRSNPELSKKNQKIMSKYQVRGVPTIILMDAEGKEFDRFTATQFQTVDAFIKKLKAAKGRKSML